jgi:sigma-B regulation protein RsbU (phosphoserine phosphatase)
VGENTFRLQKRRYSRNDFVGHFCARFEPEPGGTKIEGHIDAPRWAKYFMRIWHCPALLLRANGGTEFLRGHGAVLGVIPEWSYVDETLLLRAGDRLFFYTDGLTEAENEAAEEFGYERLVRAAAPPATESAGATNRRIMDEVASFCKGNFGDDVTLVVLAIR